MTWEGFEPDRILAQSGIDLPHGLGVGSDGSVFDKALAPMLRPRDSFNANEKLVRSADWAGGSPC